MSKIDLSDTFIKVLQLPYKPNPQAKPEHEHMVEQFFINEGYEITSQPNGPQKSPDIRIDKTPDGRIVDIPIDLKSCKGNSPVWNGGLPKQDTVYIFCSGKEQETTVFFGKDILDSETEKLLLEYAEAKKELDKKFNNSLNSNRGWAYYTRNMFIQQGGAGYTDFFNHSNRKECESNVINFDYSKYEKVDISNDSF